MRHRIFRDLEQLEDRFLPNSLTDLLGLSMLGPLFMLKQTAPAASIAQPELSFDYPVASLTDAQAAPAVVSLTEPSLTEQAWLLTPTGSQSQPREMPAQGDVFELAEPFAAAASVASINSSPPVSTPAAAGSQIALLSLGQTGPVSQFVVPAEQHPAPYIPAKPLPQPPSPVPPMA